MIFSSSKYYHSNDVLVSFCFSVDFFPTSLTVCLSFSIPCAPLYYLSLKFCLSISSFFFFFISPYLADSAICLALSLSVSLSLSLSLSTSLSSLPLSLYLSLSLSTSLSLPLSLSLSLSTSLSLSLSLSLAHPLKPFSSAPILACLVHLFPLSTPTLP